MSESLANALQEHVARDGITSLQFIPHYKSSKGKFTGIQKRNFLKELFFLAKATNSLPEFDTLFLHSSNSSFESWFFKFANYKSVVYLIPTLPRTSKFQIADSKSRVKKHQKRFFQIVAIKIRYSIISMQEFFVDFYIWRRPRLSSLNRDLEYSEKVVVDYAITASREESLEYKSLLKARNFLEADFDTGLKLKTNSDQALIILGNDIHEDNVKTEYFEVARGSLSYFLFLNPQISKLIIRPHPRSQNILSDKLLRILSFPGIQISIDRNSPLIELVCSSSSVLAEFSSVVFRLARLREIKTYALDAQMKTVIESIPWPTNLPLVVVKNGEFSIVSPKKVLNQDPVSIFPKLFVSLRKKNLIN